MGWEGLSAVAVVGQGTARNTKRSQKRSPADRAASTPPYLPAGRAVLQGRRGGPARVSESYPTKKVQCDSIRRKREATPRCVLAQCISKES